MARILVMTNFYPPHHYGGYELACKDVVERWRSRGHDVTVLASTHRLAGVEDPPGETREQVRRDLHAFLSSGEFTRIPIRERRRFELENQAALRSAIEATRPEVVSVWHMAGLPLGLLTTLVRTGIPLVGVVCDEWPGYVATTDRWMKPWLRFPKLWEPLERLTGVPSGVPKLGDAASFCFTSHNTRDRCLKSSPWFFPRSTVTYLGIDTADFPVTRHAKTAQWSWQLVTAGRLDPRKGFATAIRALTRLPSEATLQILSSVDEPYREELQRIARSEGVDDRVTFGLRDRPGLRRSYTEADAVIFPSEWEEPFGLVPVEAMACGTPVVATGTGGSGEFLVDGISCLRFHPGSPERLAAAVIRLAESEELRRRIVTAGCDLADELNLDNLTDAVEQWHMAAIDGFSRGTPRSRDMRAFLDERFA